LPGVPWFEPEKGNPQGPRQTKAGPETGDGEKGGSQAGGPPMRNLGLITHRWGAGFYALGRGGGGHSG